MSVVYFDILSAVRTQIRALTLSGVGSTPSVANEAIVLQNLPYGAEDAYDSNAMVPGVIISPALSVELDIEAGNNCEDDVQYPVIIQIIDHCQDRSDEDRLHSWLKWAQQIRRYLNHQNLQLAVHDSEGYVDTAFVDSVSALDQKKYVLEKRCVQAIKVIVIAREPRDENGSA